MTHKDIYTKFMIEYDKAGASTSYPSLTEYEVATVLDKAYNALIAQKVTGNNVRRSTVESDIKSIADLGPLTKTEMVDYEEDLSQNGRVINRSVATVPDDMLYFLQAIMRYEDGSPYTPFDNGKTEDGKDKTSDFNYNPITGSAEALPIKLVNHEIAQKFFVSAYNIPWVKQPVCYLEDRKLYVVYDPLNHPKDSGTGDRGLAVTYIRRPNTFVKDLTKYSGTVSYFDDGGQDLEDYKFECNSTVAEELISLAVAFALENVESQRLNSKLNMRGLEA
jgi:hypothetical protein